MKVITLWQPWASFIALGWKTIETRTHDRFKNLCGETIGIHAGIKWDEDWNILAREYLHDEQIIQTEHLEMDFKDWKQSNIRGSIICTAKVESTGWLTPADSEEALIVCKYDLYGLFLRDIKQITPIPAKGKQGIWNFDEKLIRYI